MSDKYLIDSHKLHLHPERVAEWKSTGDCYPIYMEVSPIGACNHRCTFCGLDFMEYKPVRLDPELLKERFKEMGELGLKSIMFAGEGEPFLHPKMPEITQYAKESGIDVSFTTNASLMKKEKAEKILPLTSWIKVSLNAGTAETYAKIHRTKESDFDKVWANLRDAIALKNVNNWECTIGVQAILLPENAHEMVTLAQKCKETGLDYLVIKPYSQHPQSHTEKYNGLRYDSFDDVAEQLEALNDEYFNVIYRSNTMKKLQLTERGYDRCLSLPFWSYMDASGHIWGCSVYLSQPDFDFGSVIDSTFKEIWGGEKRAKTMNHIHTDFDCSSCRQNCRMDEVNRYLTGLKNPQSHDNFI